jgi:DNA-binding HxlR family transcriptional regulator
MNQRTPFENVVCPIAQTLNIIGEWWTLLILRDIFYGIKRFSLILSHLGISRKVLTNRLNSLMENKIISRKKYQENPVRYEYIPTESGRALFPIIVSLMHWGDTWIYNNENIPIQLVDDHQRKITPLLINQNTQEPIKYGRVHLRPGSSIHESEWNELNEIVEKGRKIET